MLAVANAQGVIVKAVGDKGTSTGLQVNPNDPADANFISAAELSANVVNECGRTMVGGNIDIGENTENALAANQVTQVTKGSTVTMTINAVNETGQGPFTCDLDPTSNALGTSGQTPLDVQQGNAQGNGEQQIKVTLPKDMACTGSSQGNVCTVRCKNAQDFGGCVAVQQTDTKALPADNDPANIKSAQTLAGIMAQIAQNKQDLPAAIQGNENAATVPEQGPGIAQAILDSDPQITQNTNTEIAKQVKAADAGGNANTGNANANTGNGKGTGGNRGGAKAGGAATGAATGGKGGGRGQGNQAGGAATNAATGGGAAGAATGGNGNGAGRGSGLASLFGGGKNNNKRMAPSERRAKRYIDVGPDFQIGGN
ncbi:gas1-like protein [Diaporthe eres]|nr:gas1-like protein [Diaporthe eres]